MKAESTIRKHRQRLRRFIDDNRNSDDTDMQKRVDQAYGMETALLWVSANCDWNPSGFVIGEASDE
jgi:hypothetical protein